VNGEPRRPSFDELIGPEATGAERERLRGAHELLLQAGPPPELTPELRKGPSFDVMRRQQRRVVKRRAMLLLAAALSLVAVFVAGYAVADQRGGSSRKVSLPPRTLALEGTAAAPRARATLEVWHSQAGNWPMTLSVVGLRKLPPHTYYEVYLVRNGKPWGSCGTFRVAGPTRSVTLTLNAPYSLRKGDSWVVTRPGPAGAEPGKTVLHPVST
jgi:hypothetical protein